MASKPYDVSVSTTSDARPKSGISSVDPTTKFLDEFNNVVPKIDKNIVANYVVPKIDKNNGSTTKFLGNTNPSKEGMGKERTNTNKYGSSTSSENTNKCGPSTSSGSIF